MAAMVEIPKVQAPMDFGLEYLGSPAHSNLRFILEGGEVLLASSAIMSFNSPVVKKTTIEDGRSTVDVHDFSKDAVQSFLESSYSGTLKKISKAIFREVNKIAHVFEVTWLFDRCFEYFQTLVDNLTEDNFSEQLYFFDEALFILDKLKNRKHINAVVKKFASLTTCTEYFVTKYLKNLSACSEKSMDIMMEMTKEQEHILVNVLINNLEEESSLNQNSRRILESLDFKNHHPTEDSLYQTVLEKLDDIENPSAQDFKLIVKIFRRSKEINRYAALPNLFHDFQQLQHIADLDELTNFLIESPQVSNLYILYDALESWIFENYDQEERPKLLSMIESFAKIFESQMDRKGWKPIAREFLLHRENDPFLIKDSNKNLIQSPAFSAIDHYYRVVSTSTYTPDELFARDHDIKFKFDKEPSIYCGKKGDCGFILRVTAASGDPDDSFNIQLVIDPNLYPDDIHFHEGSLKTENIHLLLDMFHDDGEDTSWTNIPVTWYGKPCRDGTNKFWCWGAHHFYRAEGNHLTGDCHSRIWIRGSSRKIGLAVYYSY